MNLLTGYIEVSLAAFAVIFFMQGYIFYQILKLKNNFIFHTQDYKKKQSESDVFEKTSLGVGKRLIELEQQVQAINDKFNKNKRIELVETTSDSAVVRLHWFKEIPSNIDYCLFNI